MTVFVCLDENNGMTFNNRRQSRDSKVIEQIKAMATGRKLYMDGYSAKLFENIEITVDDDFLEKVEGDDCCFVERADVGGVSDKIDRLVIFKWNRAYPFDRTFDVSLEKRRLEECFDFEGTSHEKITCEVWVR